MGALYSISGPSGTQPEHIHTQRLHQCWSAHPAAHGPQPARYSQPQGAYSTQRTQHTDCTSTPPAQHDTSMIFFRDASCCPVLFSAASVLLRWVPSKQEVEATRQQAEGQALALTPLPRLPLHATHEKHLSLSAVLQP